VAAAPWRQIEWLGLTAVLAAGIAIRIVLLPTDGFRDDLDQFVGWVHHIATVGLGSLYGETAAGPVSFGPVMGYVWALLAAVEPGFQTAIDASDPGIRVLMKLPAVAADIGLALVVAFILRDRPRWAVAGAGVVLLHPAVIDISAWWGQYEPIYVLPALVAALLAISGRNGWAAVAIAVSLMTKPQALPLVLPFAAWFWATGGWRAVGRAVVVGTVTIAVLWLPFIAAGGPIQYLRNLEFYQSETFAILSLRAWNVWWLLQEATVGGRFLADDSAILGPLTLRHVGYAITGLVELAVAVTIVRDPRPRTLLLGLAASVLVAFVFLTQMHERYAYGALVFLALLVAEPRARWLGLAFGVVFLLNLLAAVPPTPEIRSLLPVSGVLGIVGSIAMLAITFGSLRLLAEGRPDRRGSPARRAP
jgi:Gpi18-like mannosyltransferase